MGHHPSSAIARRLPNLTPEQISALIDSPAEETLYIPLAPGIQARVAIQIIQDGLPSPNERPTRRQPTARELHHTAESLLQRVYQFHPID